ncbi:response regulator transcription factor [Actinoplanes sp. GCM10030250]|uniref:response regulator transcription factor n=1 Tax=Actinoplanes sp. GCM10030250 TaxID=3273376 RepID=UPI003617114A
MTVDAPLVLVVDDDESIRDLVSVKLEIAGYRTVTAPDGRTALSLVHRVRPDLVILDIAMPGLDGLSVCYRMHDDPATAGIPVIMLSGCATETDVDLAFVSGAVEYFAKPVRPADLVRRVRWLLRARPERINAIPDITAGVRGTVR